MLPYLSSVHVTSLPCMTVFPFMRLLRLYASFHSALTLSPCVPTFLISTSTDFPRADQLYSGNLGYSAVRILTLLSLLIPAFSLQSTPRLLTVTLRRAFNAPLPITICDSSASVSCFSPGNFRRRTSRPVSYYALFQCVAASEPTSWLSSKSHILYHLTRTLGP